jgi:hypothetical protein
MHPIFYQILFERRRRVLHLRDRARGLDPHFFADVIDRKTMSVVDRTHVFTIRHVLGFTNWVSDSIKRENAEVLVELSAGDNKMLY